MSQIHVNPHWRAETDRLGLLEPDLPIIVPTFYGQCAEDYLCLSLLRALATREGLDLTQETYAEIGAYHPVAGSSTYLLHRGLGMTGILVEANPMLLPELIRHRPHDRVLHLCITPKPQEFATLHIAPKGELSSIVPDFFEKHVNASLDSPLESVTVPAITLSALMAREFTRAPLMLSIDLEGADQAVIESYDFSKRPYIIQVEASEDYDHEAYRAIERCLTKHDYRIVARTDVNQLAVDARRLGNQVILNSLPIGTAGQDHLLDHIDLLSLDVFDTILARRAVAPVDVFRWLEKSEGWTGFAEARISAETAARNMHADRGQEVSLEEIHEILSATIHLPPDSVSKELAAEVRFCYANPTVVGLISRARLAGRRVVAISDIYLSSSEVDSLLQASGIKVDRVYTSSDHRHTDFGKYNGKLYSYVLATEGILPDRVLHVGDNLVSDITNAQAVGICAVETRQLHQVHVQEDVQAEALHPFSKTVSGSLVLGQYTKWRSYSGASRTTVETFGYAYGGPLLLGFVQYLVAQAKAAGIQRLLLLERDGNIVAAAFNALEIEEVEYRTVPASRRMTVLPALDGTDLSNLKTLFEGHGVMTERKFFDILALTPNELVPDDQETLPYTDYVKRHENFLRVKAAEEKALLIEAMAEELEMITAGKKLAWVDVGWALSSIKSLNDTLQQNLPAFCIGSHDRVFSDVAHDGYLFQRSMPAEVAAAIMSGVEVVELIFSASTHSTVRLAKAGNGIVPVPMEKSAAERVRDGYIVDVWKGALAFVKDFKDLLPGLTVEDLRQHNRIALSTLCRSPTRNQYQMLGAIPHDRIVGGRVWKQISDFWKPTLFSTEFGRIDPNTVADLRTKLNNCRRHPFRLFKDILEYRMLTVLSRLSPPLPTRMTGRFARSAEKRNPDRTDS